MMSQTSDILTLTHTGCETNKESTNKEPGQVRLPDVKKLTPLRLSTLDQKHGEKEQGQGSWMMSQTSGCLSGARTRRLA